MTDTTVQTGTETTVTQEPAQGTPEYNQMMAERYQKQFPQNADKPAATDPKVTGAPSTEIAAMPEGGHAKFYDAKTGSYNWQAHAKEAEYRAANGGKEPPASEQPKAETTDAPTVDPELGAALTQAGLNPQTMRDALLRDGKLSPEDYDKAVKAFGKSVVDDHIAGFTAATELARYKTAEYVGGMSELKAIEEFGRSLPDAERSEYQKALDGPGWKLAIDALKARMAGSKKTAGEPSLLEGGGGASEVGFSSQAEMVSAMQDPRYSPMSGKFDREYAASVHRKVALATFKRR